MHVKVSGKYLKTHLVTAAPFDERPYVTAGDAFTSCEIDKFNLGLTICYDLRFPEVCQALAVERRVNVFINSSAWPFPRVEHLRILALARAIENQSYLILANRVGTDDGVTFCGTSAIIDQYGAIVAAASVDREELIQAEISEDVIRSVRSRMAVFDHRRPDFVLIVRNQTDANSKRAVKRNHPVRCAGSILFKPDVSAIKIKAAIWLIAALGIDRKPVRQFPIDSSAYSHFAVGDDSMVQLRQAM